MNPIDQKLRCDGCGAAVSAVHLRRRLERLELATRYRPIHMECLVLQVAPPMRMEDFFYSPKPEGMARGEKAREFFQSLMAAAEVNAVKEQNEEALLGEFQRKGWYLAACCECPLEESGTAQEDVAEHYADLVVKRIRFSYRPKRVAITSRLLEPLTEAIRREKLDEAFPLKLLDCD